MDTVGKATTFSSTRRKLDYEFVYRSKFSSSEDASTSRTQYASSHSFSGASSLSHTTLEALGRGHVRPHSPPTRLPRSAPTSPSRKAPLAETQRTEMSRSFCTLSQSAIRESARTELATSVSSSPLSTYTTTNAGGLECSSQQGSVTAEVDRIVAKYTARSQDRCLNQSTLSLSDNGYSSVTSASSLGMSRRSASIECDYSRRTRDSSAHLYRSSLSSQSRSWSRMDSSTGSGALGSPSAFTRSSGVYRGRGSLSRSFDESYGSYYYKQSSARPKSPSYSPGSLSALADITSEQQTISEIRSRLEQQTKETERFTRDLLGESAAFRYTAPGHESVLSKLEIPAASTPSRPGTTYAPLGGGGLTGGGGLAYTGLARASSMDYIPISSTDRQLQYARDETGTLQSRLREALDNSEKQRMEFRNTVEELKSRLHEAVVGRDTLVGMKQRDSAGQEALIQRLQQTIEQLEKANRTQEETLMEMSGKIENVQKDHYVLESTLNQVRGLLMDQERKRGRPFFEMEPVARQCVTMLVRTVDRCIHELDAELDLRHEKVKQLQGETQAARALADEQVQQVERSSRDRIASTRDELETQLDGTNDRLVTATQQISSLQEQISMLQRQCEQQVELKEERLQDVHQRLQASRIEMDEERHQYKIKKEALELAVDQTQKELTSQKSERDEAVRKMAAIETRFNDMQQTIDELRGQVSAGKSQEKQLERVVQELKMKEGDLEGRVREKEGTVHNLELVLQQVKQEADRNLQNTVHTLEREGKETAAHQVSSLDVQLRCMTDQCQKLTKELDEAKSENRSLGQQVGELKEVGTVVKEQLDAANTGKDHLNNMLKDRISDVARLAEERDSYVKMLEEKNQKIESLQTTKEKLTLQLEEREKNFIALQQQNERISELTDCNSKSQAGVKAERDDLQRRMNEKIIEMEEMRHQRDTLSKKVGKREKQVKEMEDDNIKMAEDIREKKDSIERLLKEKDTLFDELKDSRYEVATLREDKEQLKQQLMVKKGDLGKEINKLHGKLRAAQHDLKLAQKTLTAREGVDNKAVKVAGKMQKEVTEKRGQIDSLYSKIRWLEDKMEHHSKEKRSIGEENEKLVSAVQKTAQQNERLSAELKNYLTKNNELRGKIAKMETGLERAAVKQGATQAQLEQYEQDIARLKLKHQLELKEMSRTGHLSRELDHKEAAPVRPARPTAHTMKPVSHTPLHAPGKSRSQGHRPHSQGTKKEPHCPEDPVSIKPTQAEMEMLAAESGEVGGELRKLLEEMRTLVFKQQAQELHRACDNEAIDSDDQSPAYKPKSRSRKRQTRSQGANMQHTKQSERSVSPVSDLLVTAHEENLDHGSVLSEEYNDSDDSDLFTPSSTHRPVLPVEVLSSDTQSLCKRLEQKIENLTKMGGDLQHENKEMARLMKDQDKQLKHVKKQMKT